jgi:iron complex outermembrane receptor protein
MQGVEAEGHFKLGVLTLNGSLGYIDAKYLKYITLINGSPTDVAAYRKVQNTPAWNGNASATVALPVPKGSLDLTGACRGRARPISSKCPIPISTSPPMRCSTPAWSIARRGRWTLGVYGKNLADKRYKTSGYTYVAGNATTGALTYNAQGMLIPTLGKQGVLTTYWGNPRQVFGTVTMNF